MADKTLPGDARPKDAAAASDAAELKAAGERRIAHKLSSSESRLTGIVPMPGEEAQVRASVEVDQMLFEIERSQSPMTEVQHKRLDDTYLCFVKCRSSHQPGEPAHGLYLKEYPRTPEIPWDGWRARYKAGFDMPFYPLEVLCQVCLRRDIKTPLPVTKTDDRGTLMVEPRWLWRRPKDNKRAMVEGETRIFELSGATQNQGRKEALERARAAGFEVTDG